MPCLSRRRDADRRRTQTSSPQRANPMRNEWSPGRVQAMLDTIAEIAVTFGPTVLAGMGIAVALIPNLPRRPERWIWVVAFVIVGGIVSWANYRELRSTNELQRRTLAAVT